MQTKSQHLPSITSAEHKGKRDAKSANSALKLNTKWILWYDVDVAQLH